MPFRTTHSPGSTTGGRPCRRRCSCHRAPKPPPASISIGTGTMSSPR